MPLISIVGPAGAGKTTLAAFLAQQPDVRVHTWLPNFRDPKYFLFYTRNTIEMLPTLAKAYLHKNGYSMALEDVAWMVGLNGWHRLLRRYKSQPIVMLLEEGPVVHMAYIRMFGSQLFRNAVLDNWWQRMYRHWANTLDAVIFLDASDLTLINRVRARNSPHGIKTKPDAEAIQQIRDYRDNYIYLLSMLMAESINLKIIKINTDQKTPEQVCAEVQSLLFGTHDIIESTAETQQ